MSREQDAIKRHDAAARRQTDIAAELERPALRDRDSQQHRARTNAEDARRRADRARARAESARARLRDEGVSPDDDEATM